MPQKVKAIPTATLETGTKEASGALGDGFRGILARPPGPSPPHDYRGHGDALGGRKQPNKRGSLGQRHFVEAQGYSWLAIRRESPSALERWRFSRHDSFRIQGHAYPQTAICTAKEAKSIHKHLTALRRETDHASISHSQYSTIEALSGSSEMVTELHQSRLARSCDFSSQGPANSRGDLKHEFTD